MPDLKKSISPNYLEFLTPKELSEITGLDIEEANNKINQAKQKNEIININDKFDCFKQEIKNKISKPIKLPSKRFNSLLNGGFFPAKIYLLYGKFATGKSQICHNLCISLIQENLQNQNNTLSLFIDTEGTFRPERIIQMMDEAKLEYKPEKILNQIKFLDASSTDMILIMLNKFEKDGLDENIKLIIIDSFTNYIRADLGNKDENPVKIREKMTKILQILTDLKNKYNIPIVLTSQVKGASTGNLDEKFNVRPILEYVLNEYVDETVLLYRDEFERHFAFLLNSTDSAEREIRFKITNSGIMNYR